MSLQKVSLKSLYVISEQDLYVKMRALKLHCHAQPHVLAPDPCFPERYCNNG
jgi:hypothetical protein